MDLYGRLLHDALFPAWEALRGRPTFELLRYLERTQWASLDEQTALQAGLLRRLLRHAHRHTAFYRRHLDEAGISPDRIRAPDDLARLPLLEKPLARASAKEREADVPPRVAVRKATSGSTGQPMLVAYNAESRHWRDAIRWRGYGWAGYRPGMRALHFWGVGAVPPATRFGRLKVELDHRLRRDLYIDCTPRGDDHLATVVDAIRREKPEVLVTYSQAGAALARYVQRTGARDWAPLPVLCGAERVWQHDREAMEGAFGPVFETYGCREFMLIGSECEVHEGLHTSMENLVTELLVRTADGSRPARPGEIGEVVVTDLHNLAAPFIRYVTGDRAVAREPTRCACGRWLSRIGPIEGRVTETLRDGAGNPVSGLVFSILFVSLAEHARQFQVVQHLDGAITLNIVPLHDGQMPSALDELTRRFVSKYLPGVPLRIAPVADIPRTQAGKSPLVVVEKPAV